MRDFEIQSSAPEPTEKGARCVIQVRIPEDVTYVEGHFEGHPIVPGIAQLLPLVYEPALEVWPDLGAPTAVKRLKFREALFPGHELSVHLNREPKRLRFEVRRGDTLCTSGFLLFEEPSA